MPSTATPNQSADASPYAFTHVVYALAEALMLYVRGIAHETTRPWEDREHDARRLNALCHRLLALTVRLRSIGHAAFAPLRARPASTPAAGIAPTLPTSPPATPPIPTPATTGHRRLPRLSARELARRIAAILRDIRAIAAETGRPLPEDLRRLCAQLAEAAGCHALPEYHFEAAPNPASKAPAQPHPQAHPQAHLQPPATPAHTPEPTRTLEL